MRSPKCNAYSNVMRAREPSPSDAFQPKCVSCSASLSLSLSPSKNARLRGNNQRARRGGAHGRAKRKVGAQRWRDERALVSYPTTNHLFSLSKI